MGNGSGGEKTKTRNSWKELKYLWYSDLYRYHGTANKKLALETLLRDPGFRYTFLMRLCSYLSWRKSNPIIKILFGFTRILLIHYQIKYGITIPYNANIQCGLYVGHYGGIVVSSEVTIGKNFNISQGVTVGRRNRGNKKGFPTIGDNVFVGAGAKIIGSVNIGNNVVIGANCVVTRDIPDNAVVVGIPGRVISYKGSQDYVNMLDY